MMVYAYYTFIALLALTALYLYATGYLTLGGWRNY